MTTPLFSRAGLDPSLEAPLYQQLYARLRQIILSGELQRGARLPSTRALASELGISRNTVLNAYGQLMAEGYLEGTTGSGTFVAQALPDHQLTAPASQRRPEPRPSALRAPELSQNARRQLSAPSLWTPDTGSSRLPRPFAFGMPALDAFPYALWSRLAAQAVRDLPPQAYAYQEAAGYRPLREAIAAYIGMARGVRCTPEQILVVPGSQGALDLAARVLVNPGDPVWVEDPGYLSARGALLGAGARLVPVPVDGEGLVIAAGLARAAQARLAYVTPAHQFPLGVTLSLARRLALLEWAQRANAYILEDDYDSEYRFAGRPLAALQGIDDAGRVIYIGTFSKVLFPALRVGYLSLPPSLVEAFLAVRRLTDGHMPMLEQAVLARFLAGGHLARHVRRMRALYAERRAALLEAARPLPLEIQSPPAGLYCVAWLPDGMEATAVVKAANDQGVAVTPMSHFSLEPLGRQGLILGYAEYSVADIQTGMQRLAVALRAV